MKIEKSYIVTNKGYFCSITTNTYRHSVNDVLVLVDEITNEFNCLSYSDLHVATLGSDRRKGMLAIEFNTTQEPNQEWLLVNKLDPHK